jgi:FAD/FMN-containing dehydrogenase
MRDREAAVARLSAALSGTVHLPDSDGYDEARVSFNGMIDRRPALIARCHSARDVELAVRCSVELDLPISVRGGGHSVAGHGIGEGALMVDLSAMREVSIDSDRRIARVAGGSLWDDVDAAAHAVGLAVPGGTYGDTGVGGLTVGGGLGWLLGTAALTCDNLVRAEVITATGESVVAGADGDRELLWALRGGGGNFGVVTQFEFALHERGPMLGGYVRFAADDIPVVLSYLSSLAHEMPDELVLMPWIGTWDGAEEVTCNVGVAYAGSPTDGAALLAELRSGRRPVCDEIGSMSYLEIQAMNGRLPFGLRNYWKSHFVPELDAVAIGIVADAAAARPVGVSGILLECLSGAARRVPDDSAAFGQRQAGWNVSPLAIWSDSADDDTMISWARATTAALEPLSPNGGYINYGSHDEPERALAVYGHRRLARLRAVKACYDPENRFRFNLNIPPGLPAD